MGPGPASSTLVLPFTIRRRFSRRSAEIQSERATKRCVRPFSSVPVKSVCPLTEPT